jgi:hypothetical protein
MCKGLIAGVSLTLLAAMCLGCMNSDQQPEPTEIQKEIGMLTKGNKEERFRAARQLGEMKAKEASPALMQALQDPEILVRGGAAWALGEIEDMAAIDPLIGALSDTYGLTDEQIRDRWDMRDFKWASEIWRALSKLTGQDFKSDFKAWMEWRKKRPDNGR